MPDEGRSSPELIREAVMDDAEAVADILAEAFAEDPVMNWNFAPGKPFRECFLELARGIYLRHGFGHISGNEAATLWLPAGVSPSLPFANEMRLVWAAFRKGGLAPVFRAKKVADIMAAHHPDTPHFYLFAVGVRTSSQGKGLGGAIIAEGLNRAKEAGAPAYLESSNPRNTPLYERLGFQPIAPLGLPDGAPPLLAMWRERDMPSS